MAIGNVIYTPRKALVPADVVDNLLSTATNLPLSANQGKVLGDAVTQLNTDIESAIHSNGIYDTFTENPNEWCRAMFNVDIVTYCGNDTIERYAPLNVTNTPYFWNVLTFGMAGNNSENVRVTQIAFQCFIIGTPPDINNAIFIRSQHDNMVSDWKRIC